MFCHTEVGVERPGAACAGKSDEPLGRAPTRWTLANENAAYGRISAQGQLLNTVTNQHYTMAESQNSNGTATTDAVVYNTRLDLGSDLRADLIDLLNQALADTSDLWSQTKQAHWNVKGSAFYQLHLLYDELAGKLLGPADLLAERVVLLGGYAHGTVSMAAENSRIAPFPGPQDDPSYVTAMAERWAQYAELLRNAVETSAELGDPTTEDLFTQFTHVADRGTWFIEAHVQKEMGEIVNAGADPG